MQYRTLGKTGLKVSEIGFGGEWLERHEEEHSVELLKYAVPFGDCAIAAFAVFIIKISLFYIEHLEGVFPNRWVEVEDFVHRSFSSQ